MVYFLLALTPFLTGSAGICIYWYTFCTFKGYEFDKSTNCAALPFRSLSKMRPHSWLPEISLESAEQNHFTRSESLRDCSSQKSDLKTGRRRTILFATMQYKIKDWNSKISVLDVEFMALMVSSYREDPDLMWIIPCFQGMNFPQGQQAEPMIVTISGVDDYVVQVQYHFVQNITYVLLDSLIFQTQTDDVPYSWSAHDMRSVVCYSTWYVFHSR